MYYFKELKKRVVVMIVVVIFGFVAVSARLFYLQIISGQNLQSKAVEQWLRDLPLVAKRGSITDTNGTTIAYSYSVYDIYIRPALVEDLVKESMMYSTILDVEYDEILKKLEDRTVSEYLIAKNVPKSKVDELISSGLKSFSATENYTRSYNYDALLSQIVGFTTIDGIGQCGIEEYYDTILSGTNGVSLVDGDARGKELKEGSSYYIPSIPGLNIELTINMKIQDKVETILNRAMQENGAKSASTLVMDPQSGEILAVATLPSLNLNNIDRSDSEKLFQLARSFMISDTYEPGSTFKAVVAAMALDLGVVSVDSGFYCPGYMIVDGVRINCHKKTGHGSQTLMTGFCNSCNCVFMQVVNLVGVENFYKYLELLHIDSVLGIDYPAEARSLIIPKNELTRNDFYRNGFGQSIAISGLQLMSSISASVTDGELLSPYLVKRIYNDNGDVVYSAQKKVIGQVFNEKIVPSMQKIMQYVVDHGGGKASSVEGVTVGGKTGTAQKYENGKISQGNYIASYICYSPIENPRYAVLVLFDEPKSSIYGNIVATPVAGEILKAIYEIEGKIEDASSKITDFVVVPDLRGKSLTEAGSILTGLGLYYVTEGEGNYVVYQSVRSGEKVEVGSSIMIKF